MDIAAECGISRMTFYYHFRDIYDIVDWIISLDIAIILSRRKTHDTWQDGFLFVFLAVEKNRVFVFNVYNSMSRREQLERSLTSPVTELLLSVLKEATVQKKLKDDEIFFIASFYLYAFIGVMLD